MKGKIFSLVELYMIYYGYIVDRFLDCVVEEVMVLVLKVLRIFICEDVIEINCYGGIVIVN